MRITYLDPSANAPAAAAEMSRRPDSLEGTTIGLLNNGKSNAGAVLDFVAELLLERHSNLSFERLGKPSPFKPAPDEQIQDAAVKYGAIITGVGD